MIGQYLSNTNEKAIVSILQNILELDKAEEDTRHCWDGTLRSGQQKVRTYVRGHAWRIGATALPHTLRKEWELARSLKASCKQTSL